MIRLNGASKAVMPDPSIVIAECEGVYPPSDDTLLLLRSLEVIRGERVLEMGCGTGIIALHCARAEADVTAVDSNPMAVACTRRNAEANGLAMKVILSDLFSEVEGSYDRIVFNPPYLPVEEEGLLESSWAGGVGGMMVVRRFLSEATDHLAPEGSIYLLVSSKMDERALREVLSPFNHRERAAMRLFFEELRVLELMREDPHRSHKSRG